jgi:hypothetical protein
LLMSSSKALLMSVRRIAIPAASAVVAHDPARVIGDPQTLVARAVRAARIASAFGI